MKFKRQWILFAGYAVAYRLCRLYCRMRALALSRDGMYPQYYHYSFSVPVLRMARRAVTKFLQLRGHLELQSVFFAVCPEYLSQHRPPSFCVLGKTLAKQSGSHFQLYIRRQSRDVS